MTLKNTKKNKFTNIKTILKPFQNASALCLITLIIFGFVYIANLNFLISEGFKINQHQKLLKEKSSENKDLVQELSAKLSSINIQELAKELDLVPSITTFYLKDLSQSPLSLLNQNY